MILFENQGQRRVPFFGFALFIFSLKKSTGNSQGLIGLANNSVSRAIMYKERKQIMSKSLDSIRYLHLYDALPPDFPVEIENIKHLRNLYFQLQQNKTNGQLIMIFWHKRSRRDKNMHIA